MKSALVADPFAEIRMINLSATRGANFWSRGPITRLDVTVGLFDEISSAESPGFTERLVAALPGLEAHRCSIGERGGFITRLNRGTYAPHIVEHIALELQSMIGHDAGYGRTRGGDVDGTYTIIIEHDHEAVGMRSAALALDIVQQAFAGTLGTIDHVVAELQSIAATPDVPPLTPKVTCAISGGSHRAELRTILGNEVFRDDELVVDVSPSYLLQAGLPYARADVSVVLDTQLNDVPDRYRESDRAVRLMSVLSDAMGRGGLLVAPAKAWELQDAARSNGSAVAVFSDSPDITRKDKKVARAAAWVEGNEVIVERLGKRATTVPLRTDMPPHLAAVVEILREVH